MTPPRFVGGLRWRIVSLVFLATAIDFIDRMVIAVLAPVLPGGWASPISNLPGSAPGSCWLTRPARPFPENSTTAQAAQPAGEGVAHFGEQPQQHREREAQARGPVPAGSVPVREGALGTAIFHCGDPPFAGMWKDREDMADRSMVWRNQGHFHK